MRLLIDENLSFRLIASLADCFPDSAHVRDTGLKGGADGDIWEFAKAQSMCILTKDLDFQARSLLLGAPPKVILLRLGNCTTTRAEITLRNSLSVIARFGDDASAAMLVLP